MRADAQVYDVIIRIARFWTTDLINIVVIIPDLSWLIQVQEGGKASGMVDKISV